MAAFALRGVSAPVGKYVESSSPDGAYLVVSVGKEGGRSCLAFVP